MNGVRLVIAASCVVLAGCAGACGVLAVFESKMRSARRALALDRVSGEPGAGYKRGEKHWTLRYLERLTRLLYTGSIQPLSPSVRAGRAAQTRSGKKYRSMATKAGCAKEVSVAAYCEAQVRFMAVGLAIGAFAGAVLSPELAVAFGVSAAALGRTAPRRALAAATRERAACAERRMSEMLEVVALGLRSGLSFDLSFALYGSHFDNAFARSCDRAYRRWSLGLSTREEALRDLADSYDCDQLSRVVDGVLRSLRLGTALTGTLEEAAEQARARYRAVLEERVAKAPVKMMLPTGTLILPAMLLLVMGPILLELAGGF